MRTIEDDSVNSAQRRRQTQWDYSGDTRQFKRSELEKNIGRLRSILSFCWAHRSIESFGILWSLNGVRLLARLDRDRLLSRLLADYRLLRSGRLAVCSVICFAKLFFLCKGPSRKVSAALREQIASLAEYNLRLKNFRRERVRERKSLNLQK